jgi:hypothetical protein
LEQREQRVAGLVVRHAASLLGIQCQLALGAQRDLLQRLSEIGGADGGLAFARRQQCGLVD